MTIDWAGLDDVERIVIPARPANGLWTPARGLVSGPQILRLEAKGIWSPIEGLPDCGPDGLRHWAFGRERLLTKKAPLGALIGRFGGSNIATDDTDIFLVGSIAVLTVEKTLGPLYLTINDAPECFGDNTGEVVVTIS